VIVHQQEQALMMTVLDLATPHILRTEAEYAEAVAEVDRLLRADPLSGSEEYDRLELLGVLISEYDERHNPIDDSDLTPQQIVEFMAEQKGLTRGGLAELLGGRSRLSEFLRGERSLSKGQIESLRHHLGIPADLLL
jgi:HTH-type transcriptional regulator/antitoxin HigA